MGSDTGWFSSFVTYVQFRWQDLLSLALDSIWVIVVSVLIATLVGVALGVLTYRRERPRDVVLAITSTFVTIPSLALFVLFVAVPGLGLGWRSVVLALVMYGLLPIVRNTIVGLREVDPAIVESAKGMGMGSTRLLLTIELPLAWPVILTGMRVSTMVLVGISAIGAYINGPGLGQDIFSGLARIGGASALNLVLGGVLGLIILAILFDLVYGLLSLITVPKGLR